MIATAGQPIAVVVIHHFGRPGQKGTAAPGVRVLFAFHQLTKRFITPSLIGVMLCAIFGGCHRRGYTDVYFESMASEIRDLQDQLYEYDHEYRLLEQELDSLRRHNAVIQSQPNPGSANSQLKSPLGFSPRETLPSPRNGKANGKDEKPSQDLIPPSIIIEPDGLRSPSSTQPEEVEPAPVERPSLPASKVTPTEEFDFNPEDFVIPSITTGAAMPPPNATRNLQVAPENDLEVGLSQIELPLQLSSVQSGNKARVTEATEVVVDRRVVEIAFHPILSRSINLNEDEYDEGLFLVLQPRNQRGQYVPIPANLTIEIIDPGRNEEKAVIGQWNFSASEVSGKTQPIGSQQGIHLTLLWNGPNPKSDRVTVQLTYTFENGRQVVARREFFINSPSTLKTVWAPRAERLENESTMGTVVAQTPLNTVVPASGVQSGLTSGQAAQVIGPYPTPVPAPKPLR